MPRLKRSRFIAALLLVGVALAALGSVQTDRPKVVATTTIAGDVVSVIGGEAISLAILLPVGSDPHAYEPAPQDLVAVAEADLIFINGAGLEAFLEPLLQNSGTEAEVVSVSDGVALRHMEEEHSGEEEAPPGESDPHVWFDPNNVVIWAKNIEQRLSELDPANAKLYAANAASYEAALHELDTWIIEQVAQVPQERRKLVTDHLAFGYFADRYGFEQVGAIFPGFSTLAEPSAQELAELEETIRRLGVPAIFVGTTVNPALAEQIAADTGTKVVFLYTGSLSEPGGPASSYLKLMRYDVAALAAALK
jgi:manganese/iron transport system substrate-binding protein